MNLHDLHFIGGLGLLRHENTWITLGAAPSIATPTFVDSATGTNSATIPSHEAGDLILAFAFRDGSTTISLPEGWDNLYNGENNATYLRVVSKTSDGNETETGTFTNATSVIVAIYRGASGVGAIASTAYDDAGGTDIQIPALELDVTNGSSIVTAFVGHRVPDNDYTTPPSGMVLRDSTTDATDTAVLFDTHVGVTEFSAKNMDGGGSSSGRHGFSIEIKALVATSIPEDFSVISANGFNTLWWTDAPGSTGTAIYRSSTSGSGHSLLTTVGTGVEKYKDEGLDNDTTYYYVISAVYDAQESEYTEERNGTPELHLITVNPRIASNGDDGYVQNPYGANDFNSLNATTPNSTVDHAYIGNAFRTYFRFQLNVEQGTPIDAATVTFISRANRDTENTSVTIRAWDVDNATQFANTSDFLTGWNNRTTASVSWPGSGSKTTNGQTINTPDIKAVIQEIVDRDGWESGNYVTLIMSGSNDSYAMRTNEYLSGSGRATLNVTFESFAEPQRPMLGFAPEGRVDFNTAAPTWGNGKLMKGDDLTRFQGLVWYAENNTEVSGLIDDDDIYQLARPVRSAAISMLAALRVTKYLGFLDRCVAWLDEAAAELAVGWRGTNTPFSHGYSPYRTWVVRGGGQANNTVGTDFSRMNEQKWHSCILEVMDALKANFGKTSPAEYDYEAKYNYWMTYLTDDFMPKWRDATYSTSGGGSQADYKGLWANGDTYRAPSGTWPVVTHEYEGHSTISATHHAYYWNKLVNDPVAMEWAEDITHDWWTTDCIVVNDETYGNIRAWHHSLISRGGAEEYAQASIYAGYEYQDMIMAYLEGAFSDEITPTRLTEMARAAQVWMLMDNYSGLNASSEAAYKDVARETQRGALTINSGHIRPTLMQVVYNPTMWGLVFEDTEAPSITDRAVYAQNTAGGGFATPLYPHVNTAMLIKTALEEESGTPAVSQIMQGSPLIEPNLLEFTDEPFTANSGGTFTGLKILGDGEPCVYVRTNQLLTFIDCDFAFTNTTEGSTAIQAIRFDWGGCQAVFQNCRFFGINPNVAGRFIKRAIDFQFGVKLHVEDCYFQGGGIYVGDVDAAMDLVVRNNLARNIEGRYSDGDGGWVNGETHGTHHEYVQFLQLNAPSGQTWSNGAVIEWNEVINDPGDSRPEDVISVHQIGGTSGNPVLIENNLVWGAYPSVPSTFGYTGGGIMCQDGSQGVSGSYVVARGNTVLNTSNYGIAAAAGNDILIEDNVILKTPNLVAGGQTVDLDNGIYVRNAGDGHVVQNNVIRWEFRNGTRHNLSLTDDDWDEGGNTEAPGPLTESDIEAAVVAYRARKAVEMA